MLIIQRGEPRKIQNNQTKDKTMKKPIYQSILIICKYHGPTMIRGSRVSFRLGIPDSKAHFISYNYELNCIYEMVAHHIEKESTTILFLGYNAPYTLGRKILDGDKEVRIFGNYVTVKAHVYELPGLSGHADHAGMVQYLSDRTISTVKEVFLVHGEPQGQVALAESLKNAGFASITIPERGTVVTI